MATLDQRVEFSRLQQVRERLRGAMAQHALALLEGRMDSTPDDLMLATNIATSPDALMPRFLDALSYGASPLVEKFFEGGQAIEVLEDEDFESAVLEAWPVQVQLEVALRGSAGR